METFGNNTTLAEVNAYQRMYKKPSFFFLGFLSVIGLVGNMFVLYIYGHRMKKKKVQHFITLLAVYDVLCCLFGLPLKMLELWMPVMYPSSALCKMQNAVICFVCVASGLTLMVISLDRYKKVCRSTKPQLSLFHVKISFVLITLVSFIFAITSVFVYDRISKPMAPDIDLVVHICSLDFSSLVTQVYFLALIGKLITIIVILLVLYCLVWRTAKKHVASIPVSYQVTLYRCTSQIGQSKRQPKTNTTRILVLITLLFVVSFVPSLCFSVIFTDLFRANYSTPVKAFIEFMYNMWGLNSSMNPIIYGFYNRNFLIQARNIFTRLGGMKPQKSVTSGDTSGTL